MKTEIIIYKILSFLLLPVAVLLGILCVAAIPMALSFPPALINVFLLACMVIYVFASSMFLRKGIEAEQKCRPVLRDWIRINGVITFIFCGLMMASFIILKSHPELLEKSLQQWSGSSYLPAGASEKDLRSSMASASTIFSVLGVVMMIHVLITFHLMRRYRQVFEPERMDTGD